MRLVWHPPFTPACVGLFLAFAPAAAQQRDPYAGSRRRMVAEFIEQEGVEDPRVLAAMREVPRHQFVPPNLRAHAYFDTALPIGHKQTISPPFIVAYMTESIDPQPDDRVLEIGTGSGYQAAVLSGLVKEVYTIEIVEPLGRQAARRLARLGYDNVSAKVGDGYQGWPEHAPFDKIIVTCSPEDVPRPLVEQLREGGRMIIPLGKRYQQVFYLFEKQEGKLVPQRLIPTLFVPMTGISEERRTIQPDPLNPQIVNAGFEIDDNGDGKADSWHYQRQTSLVEEDAPAGRRYIRFENEEPGRAAHALQGMAIDGRGIAAVAIRLRVRTEGAQRGDERYHKPAFMIHFYDEQRRPIADVIVGSWTGTTSWHEAAAEVEVPVRAREAVVRVGLNGGTGRLDVDDVSMTTERR